MNQMEKCALIGQAGIGGLRVKKDTTFDFYFSEKDAEASFEHYQKVFSSYKKAWEDADHNGSCVKNPGCCMACFYAEDFLENGLMVAIGMSRRPNERYLAQEFWKHWTDSYEIPELFPEYVGEWVAWVIKKAEQENVFKFI